MKKENGIIRLTVKDDGIGFDKSIKNKGNGLYNMEQRAGALNGKLTIDTKAGEGTTIQLTFNC